MPDNNNNKSSRNKQLNAVKRKNQVDGKTAAMDTRNKSKNENKNSQTEASGPPSKKPKTVQINGNFLWFAHVCLQFIVVITG